MPIPNQRNAMELSADELRNAVTEHGSSVRITCRVQPRASRCAVVGMYDGALKIALTAPPVEGKANAALSAFIADLFQCPKSSVSIVSGAASKNKIIEIHGVNAADVYARLC